MVVSGGRPTGWAADHRNQAICSHGSRFLPARGRELCFLERTLLHPAFEQAVPTLDVTKTLQLTWLYWKVFAGRFCSFSKELCQTNFVAAFWLLY